MLGRLFLLRPTGAVQVTVHHQLGEREKAEIDFVVLHLPILQAGHRLPHGLEVDLGIHVLNLRERRQLRGEILFQFKRQREVFLDVIARVGKFVTLTHRRPLQLHRHEQQRRLQLALRILRIAPMQHAQREVKHIHTALFNVRTSRPFGVQQAPLQPAIRIVCLQPRIAQLPFTQRLQPFLTQRPSRRRILHTGQMFAGQHIDLVLQRSR